MARLAVLTDRLPSDPSWKGAYTWEIIRQLCETQHEVAVFTTQDPDLIPLTHSRLTVARPASSFSAEKLPKWAQALLVYRPEVVQTFPLDQSSRWPSLSVWPYLDAFCKVMPGLKRVSTMFDREDFATGLATHPWHQGADSWTVFSAPLESEARHVFQGRIDAVPLDEITWADEEFESEDRGYMFVPAPVSEWRHRNHGLALLADYLIRHSGTTAVINGGWGDLSLSERRKGWSALVPVASRVRLLEAQPLNRFAARARSASRVWVEALAPDTWRYLLSVRIAESLGKELIGAHTMPALPAGSTANFLSRIYLT